MQDVLPPNPGDKERSIRNIPVPSSRRHFSPLPEDYAPEHGGGRSKSFWFLGAAVVVACILAAVLISNFFFSGATVTVEPKTADLTLPPTIQAGLDAPVGSLSYQAMSVGGDATRTVAASGSTPVSTYAQGTIIISNTYSASTQKLIANTRFEAPDGKIYRIHNAIVVPGGKKQADGTFAPGQVEATVYADQPGADYNKSDTTFTIPGFKGQPQYSKFSAHADSISGGLVGNQPAVSAADKAAAEQQMREEIANALPNAAAAKLPEGFIPVQGTLAIHWGDVASKDAGDGHATLSLEATATEFIVRQADLANALAKLQVSGYQGEAVSFKDPSSLTLSVPAGASLTGNLLTIALSGKGTLVWQFDPEAIRQALAGKNKSEFDSILKGFAPAVANANASLRPFWSSSFPASPAKIKVEGKTN